MAKSVSFKESISIVCRVRFGSINKLEVMIGQSNLEKLKTLGFIACGKSYDDKRMIDTWKATKSVLDYKKRMSGGFIFSF